MKKLRITIASAAIVGALATATLAAAPANASATSTSGPVTVHVTGSGLTINSSYTQYTGGATGPWVRGSQWPANGQFSTTTSWNIGPVCRITTTYTATFGAWKAKGNTTFYGQWSHQPNVWDSHKPSVGIHS